jgi:hypothetical protein
MARIKYHPFLGIDYIDCSRPDGWTIVEEPMNIGFRPTLPRAIARLGDGLPRPIRRLKCR